MIPHMLLTHICDGLRHVEGRTIGGRHYGRGLIGGRRLEIQIGQVVHSCRLH